MWLLGVGLALVLITAILLGVRRLFNRMQDVTTPRDDEAEERNRAVVSSSIYISGSGRF